MKEKNSVEIATISLEDRRREICSFFEAKIRSVKRCVVGKGFEVVVNKQIDFIKPDLGSQVFVVLVGPVGNKGAAQCLQHLIGRIVAGARRKQNPTSVKATSAP